MFYINIGNRQYSSFFSTFILEKTSDASGEIVLTSSSNHRCCCCCCCCFFQLLFYDIYVLFILSLGGPAIQHAPGLERMK